MVEFQLTEIKFATPGAGWWTRVSNDPPMFEPIAVWCYVVARNPRNEEVHLIVPFTKGDVDDFNVYNINYANSLGNRWEINEEWLSRELFHDADFHVPGEVLKEFSQPRT